MRKSRKVLIAIVLAVVLLVGGTTGVVLAQDNSDARKTSCESFLNRVCEIYEENTGDTLNVEALKEALEQTHEELRGQDRQIKSEPDTSFLNRVCEIYEENTGDVLDVDAVKEAQKQARQEQLGEAITNRIEKMAEKGILTEDEAEEMLDWWNARPNVAGFDILGPGGHHRGGGHGCFGGMSAGPSQRFERSMPNADTIE